MKKNIFPSLLLLLVLIFFSCTSKAPTTSPSTPPTLSSEDLRIQMRKSYEDLSKLFTYIWTPEEFMNSKSEATIKKLLDHLVTHFHSIDQIATNQLANKGALTDPGFALTLAWHRSQLEDIKNRFNAGAKDYANWRLRGITSNCVACHSRYQVPTRFFGDLPPTGDHSFEAQLASAEFLFATRQFDDARTAYFTLATSAGQFPTSSRRSLQALKMWLLIEIRVKNNPQNTTNKLKEFLSATQLHPHEESTVQHWIEILEKTNPIPSPLESEFAINKSTLLLNETQNAKTREEQELNLIQNLQITALLHQILEKPQTIEVRKKGVCMLAQAYSQILIPSLEAFQDLYLEQCIREFPKTEEAVNAFRIYQEKIEESSTGAGGLHLDETQKNKLEELGKIAGVIYTNRE